MSLRARAHQALTKLPGKLGDVARKANEALGRPLAGEHELADRDAFAKRSGTPAPVKPVATTPATATAQAPVIVYYIDRKDQKRDVNKLTDILDANGVNYTVTNIEDDAAAQYAVKRDSNGLRLPVVFIAGECLGGREHVVNAASSGELKKKVFG